MTRMPLPVLAGPASRRSVLGLSLAGLSAIVGAGRGVAQPAPPRIVAAGGVVTEILYAIGQEGLLVGVDATSLHPPQAMRDKPNVGYFRALSVEGVLSLRPTHVLATEGAGPPDALKLIAEAGVRVERLPEDLTPKGVTDRIRRIGAFAGAQDRAEALAAEVEGRFAALARQPAAAPRKRVLFVLSLQNGRALVGGRKTAADAMIALAGATNAAEAVEGYKPLTDEGIISAAPDAILMMSHTNHAAAADEVFSRAAFAATPAARTRALVVMDGLYLLGFGPRTPDAARDLMTAVYGDAPGRQSVRQ